MSIRRISGRSLASALALAGVSSPALAETARAVDGSVPASQAGGEMIEELYVEGRYADIAAARAAAARVPGGVTVVDLEDLGNRTVLSLADLLRYVPGVFASSASGGDGVFFTSRGSNLDATDYDGNGIKLLQDGLSVTSADGNNHNRVIDPLAARSATVARGAISTRNTWRHTAYATLPHRTRRC